MAKNNTGLLVDLDFCVGCYACQSCCSEHWQLPVGSTYLRVLNCRPEEIDGKLQMFLCPIPLKLDYCAQCVDSEEGTPCTKICIGKAITIGDADALAAKAKDLGRPSCLFR
ncbi:hypothetical protein FACS1894104_2980 [Actinomycetota bacterium]|nr:hypothetical protein FACS1894104_2980 [Actinomycetota bacterium]